METSSVGEYGALLEQTMRVRLGTYMDWSAIDGKPERHLCQITER
jgi:hypothetical protein